MDNYQTTSQHVEQMFQQAPEQDEAETRAPAYQQFGDMAAAANARDSSPRKPEESPKTKESSKPKSEEPQPTAPEQSAEKKGEMSHPEPQAEMHQSHPVTTMNDDSLMENPAEPEKQMMFESDPLPTGDVDMENEELPAIVQQKTDVDVEMQQPAEPEVEEMETEVAEDATEAAQEEPEPEPEPEPHPKQPEPIVQPEKPEEEAQKAEPEPMEVDEPEAEEQEQEEEKAPVQEDKNDEDVEMSEPQHEAEPPKPVPVIAAVAVAAVQQAPPPSKKLAEKKQSPPKQAPKSAAKSGSEEKKQADPDKSPYEEELKECSRLVDWLFNLEEAAMFREPVDHKALGLNDYLQTIKKPMDLGTVKNKLAKSGYKKASLVYADVKLTFNNCIKYNCPGSTVYVFAQNLLKLFENRYKHINKYDEIIARGKHIDAAQLAPVTADKIKELLQFLPQLDENELGRVVETLEFKCPWVLDNMFSDDGDELDIEIYNIPSVVAQEIINMCTKCLAERKRAAELEELRDAPKPPVPESVKAVNGSTVQGTTATSLVGTGAPTEEPGKQDETDADGDVPMVGV